MSDQSIHQITKAIEEAGWDWLLRSNKKGDPVSNEPYFANITFGNAINELGTSNPEFRRHYAYGNSAQEAINAAFKLFKNSQH